MTAALDGTRPLTLDDPGYFDRLAAFEERHWWSLGVWRLSACWLDAALDGRAGLRALDVGCGAGFNAVRLAGRREVGTVVGLDPSPAALAHARRRHGHPLVKGSALDLPFGGGAFDLVTCLDVVQHLPTGGDRRAAVEVARVLAPGGVALVRSNGIGFGPEGSAYRLAALAGLFRSAGLVVRRATYANALPALAQEARGRIPRAGTRPHPADGGLRVEARPGRADRLLRGVAGAEAWLAGRVGWRLPFGHSTLVLAEKPGRR